MIEQNDKSISPLTNPEPTLAQANRLSIGSLSREQCLEELLVLASRYPKTLSSSRLRRGLTTWVNLRRYEKGVLKDRDRRAIRKKDAARAIRLVNRLRYLSTVSLAGAARMLGLKRWEFHRLAVLYSLRPVRPFRSSSRSRAWSTPSDPRWRIESVGSISHNRRVLDWREDTARSRSSPRLKALFDQTTGTGSEILREALRGDEPSFLIWLDWLEDQDSSLLLDRHALIRDAKLAGLFRPHYKPEAGSP